MLVKPILLSGHARLRARQRGATDSEITETIRESAWVGAGRGRKECQRDFVFGREWNGQFYATKRVRPIFLDHAQEIVVVTVYVYYF
jgi:hypothetical protein